MREAALVLAQQVRAAVEAAARDTDDVRDEAALNRASVLLAVATRLSGELVRLLDAPAPGSPA